MTSLPINIKQDKSTCQEQKINLTLNKQPLPNTATTLQPEQKVYLYGDIQYTGTLIRPLERTYPPKWTVELDGGGYEAVNLTHISLIESQPSSRIEPNLEIPFSDEPEATTSQLEREIIALKKEVQKLQQENQELTEELTETKQIIRRAKDISPVMRLSLQRVMRLAHQACMDIKRTVGGWVLKMGNKARKFRRLADIWDILSQDDWFLSEIFAPEKLIPLDKIEAPRPRKRPTPAEKTTMPLMSPKEILRRRRMGMPKCS